VAEDLEPVRLHLDVAGVAVAEDIAGMESVVDLVLRVQDAADALPLLVQVAVAAIDASVRARDQLRGPAQDLLESPAPRLDNCFCIVNRIIENNEGSMGTSG
jgi:hypothetical protein